MVTVACDEQQHLSWARHDCSAASRKSIDLHAYTQSAHLTPFTSAWSVEVAVETADVTSSVVANGVKTPLAGVTPTYPCACVTNVILPSEVVWMAGLTERGRIDTEE